MMHQVHSTLVRALRCKPQTSLCIVESVLQTKMRHISAVSEPSVIRIPVKMAEKMQEAKRNQKRHRREKILRQSRQGAKSALIISCKRRNLNHYCHQTYNKFEEIPLASKGWCHKKSAGDYFFINSYGKNPAFANLEDETLDFKSLGLSNDLVSQIMKLGFEAPTNIQALAIPHIIEGKNTLITAETGNGKTLAFVAPMLQQIANSKRRFGNDLPFNSPLGLIIVPGRELADQIQSVAAVLGRELGINVKVIKGIKTKQQTLKADMKEVHLVVATIGALSKLTTAGVYKTNLVRHIAIDEADSMLDDSFNEKLVHYMSKFPIQGAQSEDHIHPVALSGCQLTLVSATMPRSLETILDPIVDIESIEQISTPYLHRIMPHVPQHFFRVNSRTKAEKLLELVKRDKAQETPVIIFSNTSKASNFVSLFLNENGISCINVNGEMNAMLREGRFEQFQCGKVLALSCTDLTSRGLDTVRAGHIINFEFPKFVSDYIHRCGRTGRVGSSMTGMVTNLVQHRDEVEIVQKIEYAARKTVEFHNVNANITRALVGRAVKQGGNIE